MTSIDINLISNQSSSLSLYCSPLGCCWSCCWSCCCCWQSCLSLLLLLTCCLLLLHLQSCTVIIIHLIAHIVHVVVVVVVIVMVGCCLLHVMSQHFLNVVSVPGTTVDIRNIPDREIVWKKGVFSRHLIIWSLGSGKVSGWLCLFWMIRTQIWENLE